VNDFEADLYDTEHTIHTMSLTVMMTNFDGQSALLVWQRDITERKQAEKVTQQSEERLAMALRGANLGLWDWQANPEMMVTNDIWSEMLGYQRAELDALYGNTTARWSNMVYPEDMARAVDHFTKFVNGELTVYRIELRMMTKNGEPKWILAVGDAVAHDAAGKVSRMVGIHQDITERKQLEQSMLNSQAHIRDLRLIETEPVMAISDAPFKQQESC
jgi:PAS domain S-box-containing protein